MVRFSRVFEHLEPRAKKLLSKLATQQTSSIFLLLGLTLIFSQTLLAASSNEKVVVQGRIIDGSGVAVTDSNVSFDIKIYSPTTGTPGSHCLLYEETQLLDMSSSGGTFALQVGTGTRVGSGPTLRETFTNAAVASFGSLTCGVGTSYSPGAIDDRSIEMTVSFASQNLSLNPIPVKAVPYAFQANQIGGYSINNLVRLNGAGSSTNLDVDQFNYLTGFFHDNGTNGVLTDDYLDAQNLLIKNVPSPVANTDAVNKSYVDTAVAAVSGSLPTLTSAKIWVGNSSNAAAAVALSGDASIDNTGKLTVTGLQTKPVTLTSLAAKDTLMYNGSAWINMNIPTCGGSQYLTFDGTSYSCVTTTNSPTGAALNSANIWVGNSGNLAAPVLMSGDASLSNGGALTVTGIQSKPVTLTSLSSGQVLQYNGSQWVNTTISTTPVGQALTSANMWVGNGSGVAEPVGMTGDVTMDNAGATTIAKLKGTDVAISSLSSNQVLQYNGSQWVNASLSATLPSLNDAKLWVGNSSSVPVAVSAGGDVTMDDTGAFTLAKIQGKTVTAGTPSSNQVLQYNGSQWVNATISASPVGEALTSANIWVGNGSNLAEPVAASGDVSLDNTGKFVVNKINNTTVAGVGLANTDLLQNVSGSTLAANTLLVTNGTDTGVTAIPAQNSAVLITDATGVPAWSTSATATGQVLQYNGSAWVPGTVSTTPTGQTLTSANMWVGNGSGVAEPVAMSGDASMDNTGKLTVTGIQSQPVSISSLSSNQVLQYNGSQWVNASLSATLPSLNDAKLWVGNSSNVPVAVSAGGDVTMDDAGAFTLAKIQGKTVTAGTPSANEVLQYNGSQWVNGTVSTTPTGQTLTSANMWVGNGSNKAEPVTAGGDVAMDNTGAFTVNKIQTSPVVITTPSANQVLQYNGSQWLNVTPNYQSTTLASNNVWIGNASNIAAATAMPTCAAGHYLTYNGSAFSCALDAGSTGSVTSLAATAPLAVDVSTGNVTASMTLTSGHVYVGNASNLAADVALGGDAGIDATGKLSVTGIQSKPVTLTSLSSGEVLQYNGSQWVNATISTTPVGQALASTNMWVGNGSGVAEPVAMSGDVTMDNAGATTIGKLKGTDVTISSLSSNQVLQYNGSQWVNASLSATLPSLNDAKLWVGNGSNVATAVSAGGDVTMDDTGAFTLAKIQGKTVTAGTPSTNEVLQYNGSQWVNATISTTPVGQSLTSANIWVGNGSNLAAAVAASGDVSLDNTGKFVVNKINNTTVAGVGLANNDLLQNVSGSTLAANTLLVTNGTDTGVTAIPAQNSAVLITDATGVPAWSTSATATGQVLQYNGSAWVPGTVSTTPTGQTLTSANIWVGNSSGVAEPVGMSGDASLSSGGALTVNKIQSSTVTISSPSANQILQYNGSAWINTALSAATLPALNDAKLWVGNSSNVASPVSAGGDVTMDDTGAFTLAKIQGKTVTASTPSSNQVLQYNGSQWVNATLSTTPTGQTLTSANMWVGNGSNLAEPVTAGGDVAMDNTGAFTVNKIQSSTVTISSPSANQILQYNGSAWVNTALSASTLPSLSSANIWVGNGSSVASPIAPSGDVTMLNTGAFTVAGLSNKPLNISGLAANQILQYNGSQWVNIAANYQSNTLNSGNIWIGNTSNVAVGVPTSGDVTLSSAGVFGVAKISGSPVSISGASANQILQYNGSAWINTALSASTLPALNDAKLWVGNSSNVAAPVSASGDASMDDTGKFTVTGLSGKALNISSPAANQVLQYNGSQWLNVTPTYQSNSLTSANIWVGNGSNVATGVSMSGDVTIDNTGATTIGKLKGSTVTLSGLAANQVLQYNGSQWVNGTVSSSPTGQTLAAGSMWLGNSSGVAAATAMSGDVTITSGGVTTLGKINGNTINVSSLSSGQVLQYNGSQWVNASVVAGSGTTNYVAKFSASGTVANSSITDDGTYVQSTKVFRGPSSVTNAGTTIDFSTGNIQYTSASCGAMTLNNMKDGATYTLAVQGTTSGTCVFTAWSGSGTGSVSVLYPPDYAATTSTYQTLFSFVVVGSTAYVTWIPGYHP